MRLEPLVVAPVVVVHLAADAEAVLLDLLVIEVLDKHIMVDLVRCNDAREPAGSLPAASRTSTLDSRRPADVVVRHRN